MKNLVPNIILSVFIGLMTLSTVFAGGYNVGDMAKSFTLKNVDGNMVSLGDYKEAKGFIVVFTCNHCPYAKLYEQRIIDLHKKYAVDGYPVIAINPNDPVKQPDDSFENMIKRSKQKAYPFVYLFDETQNTAKSYGATRTPHVYLLNKVQDKYQVAYIGAIDDNPQSAEDVENKYVENAIAALKKGKKVAISSTKAIGCTIKWK
ncbi:thioredoxin family protein [Hyphobacterium sp. CCMP332]|nr:thioredoxin family protein [Hyphobacterium sp. CCMP332]